MIESLNIKVSNVSFINNNEEDDVQLRFNGTNGQINISGYIVNTQVEFFGSASSPETINELAKQKLNELSEPVAG